MKESRADTGVKHLPKNCEGYMLGSQDWQELLELSSGSTTPGYNGKRATATSAQHVTKITEAGFSIKQSYIYIYLCDWSTINCTSLSTTPWTNIVWVCNNSGLDTAAPLMQRWREGESGQNTDVHQPPRYSVHWHALIKNNWQTRDMHTEDGHTYINTRTQSDRQTDRCTRETH